MNSIKYMRVSMQKNKTCKVMDMKKKKKKKNSDKPVKKEVGNRGKGEEKSKLLVVLLDKSFQNIHFPNLFFEFIFIY